MCLDTVDKEEKDQCNKMHAIIKDHGLHGEFRWLVAQKDPVRNGELYRYIAGIYTPRHLSLVTGCKQGPRAYVWSEVV